MRVYVSGATGFVGRHVAGELAARGADVRTKRVDILDGAALEHVIDGCDAVVHTAALYSYDAPADRCWAVNVEGTRTILDAVVRRGVRRFLYTSTAGTCGPVLGREATEQDGPPGWELSVPYKRTKLAAERLVLEAALHGVDGVVVNPTTPVGPGDTRPTPTGAMVRGVATGRIRGYVASGLNVVDVRDVARGHALALERGRTGTRYLLGGENLTLRDLFAEIAALAGRPAPRIRVPYAAARLLAGVGLANAHEVRLALLPMFFSSEKARRELGYAPGPVGAALAAAVEEALGYRPIRRATRSAPAPSAAPATPSRR